VSGARDEDRRVVPIRNRLPAITKLQVESQTNNLGGYTVGRLLQIRAEFHDEDPGDTLTARWMHYPAPDSPPGSQPFTVISDTSATLRPNAIGEWIVELTVDDGTPGGEGVATEDLSIRVDPDLDPCLGPLSPPPASSDAPILVARELGPRVFRVASVIDDLDPYPYEVGSPDADLGRPAFRWFLGRGAGPLGEVPGSDQADYTLRPDAFAPGEELTLRVEVQDRVPGWPACPIDEATCASEVPACLQRATWKVVVR
jgi:hypothetical protein